MISHELEEMRAQIGILKDKLEKQTIINENHIRKSMKSKMSDVNRTITATIFLGAFALIYCTWFFYTQGCSLAFTVSTAVMLATCLALTIIQRITLGKIDLSEGSLIETAQKLGKIKKHYQNWHLIAIPMITLWVAWVMYEMISIMGLDTPMAIGFCCGAGVGVIIGGIFGTRINHKIIRRTEEILSQIEELQRT